MKRTVFAAALVAAAPWAFAQNVEVPKVQCEPKPQMLGPNMMRDRTVKRQFDSDLKKYQECMKAYIAEREASIKAHTAAGNAAIEEYNATMKELQDKQAASKE
jgi:hypothetical protein